ncbi:MAG: hypothetical protein IIU88_01990 [Clostridia bacterium]|nr:hypothetical protein [Clostridia bacterium]
MNPQEDYIPAAAQAPSPTPPQGAEKESPRAYAYAALALGLLSLFCCCCYYAAGAVAVLSIVFACLAKKRNGGKLPTPALVGLILAILGLLLFLCMIGLEIYLASLPTEELERLLQSYFDAIGMEPGELPLPEMTP